MPSVGLGGGLETVINFYGRGRDAIDLIVDEGSFQENLCGGERLDPEWAESALVGTARISGETVTVIANDAGFANLVSEWSTPASWDWKKALRWRMLST